MKKIVLEAAVFMLSIVGNAQAGNWAISCVNGSCEASSGALKIYWSSPVNSIDSGQLTGVNGIPLSIDDYQTAEKRINNVLESAITYKSSSETGVKASGEQHGSGGHAQESGSSENLFSNKRSVSQTKTQGKKIGINYNLAFVQWIGDSQYSDRGPVRRYLDASEKVLKSYNDGSINELVDQFYLFKNAEQIDGVAVDAKITPENKELVLSKYIGVTMYPREEDQNKRYLAAHENVTRLMESGNQKEQQEMTADFQKNVIALAIMAKPGATALEIYKTDKELAYAKWFGDGYVAKNTNLLTPQDRYVSAIYNVRKYGDTPFFQDQRKVFEAAIANKDPSTQIVAVKSSPIAKPIIAVGVLGAIGVGGFVFYQKKKAVKTERANS